MTCHARQTLKSKKGQGIVTSQVMYVLRIDSTNRLLYNRSRCRKENKGETDGATHPLGGADLARTAAEHAGVIVQVDRRVTHGLRSARPQRRCRQDLGVSVPCQVAWKVTDGGTSPSTSVPLILTRRTSSWNASVTCKFVFAEHSAVRWTSA